MKIILDKITKKYSNTTALNEVSLNIKKNKITAILGPSGCGKTTLLRIIAGLIKQNDGDIYFNDKRVNNLPTQKRNAAMVFQNYALFPHLSVKENIAYGLKNQIKDKKIIKEKVNTVLDMVKLNNLGNRKINELSGGQQQRVALARAIVINPNVLLFDEPLSNLDEKLRESMRYQIKKLQNKTKITTIYVTHDQREALALADEIVVMNKGDINQIDTPERLYKYPKNAFVADFLGQKNIFSINFLKEIADNKNIIIPNNKKVKQFLIRPEEIIISKNGIKCKIVDKENRGNIYRYTLEFNNNFLIMDLINRLDSQVYSINEYIYIDFSKDSIHFLEK